uniref:FXNA-like protease n=1 Tax=Clastoptera arizonana TaxID=38151 RepID=A0A1B6BYM8_9HEMI
MLRQRAKGSADDEWPPPPPPLAEDKPALCASKIHRLSTTGTTIAVISVAGLIYLIAVLLNNRLPLPLNISDESFHPNRFIAERARNSLEQLVDLGPKVVGSYENEMLAVHLLSVQINYTMLQAKPVHKITYDLQHASGSYYLGYKPIGMASVYNNVQNIIVKIGPHVNATSSLLVNCHFDSVPSSPGASDDGLNCVVMLEVLRVLSRQDKPLQQNVIFLFNGAEETPLQASHGFIAHHKWAKEVRAFVNLESCGAGGRETLFQAGPNHPWLIEQYAKSVPFPNGLVLAEEIFQGGLIPSDTDFRIFRDFGHIPGLDFAHCKNGYVYHTKYDRLDQILPSVFQHTGDNLLALIRQIVSSKEIQNPELYKEGRQVYFDVGGLFFVHYSETEGIVLNLAAVMLSVYTVFQNTFLFTTGMKRKEVCQQLVMSVVVPGLGFILALASVILVGFVLDHTHSTLTWYNQSWLIIPLYYMPTLFALGLPLYFFNACKSNSLCTGVQVQLYCNGIQLLWSILLFMATAAGLRSSYILMLLVLIPAMANFLLILCQLQRSVPVWLSGYMASALLPVFYIVYVSLLAMQLFIPISGRMGSTTNPELLLGILSMLLCTLAASYFIPLVVLIKKPWVVFLGLFILHVSTLLSVMYTPLGFPYVADPAGPTPQRIMIMHTERSFYDISGFERKHDHGYFIVNLDRRVNELGKVVPKIESALSIEKDCQSEVYCGIPVFSSRLKPSSSLGKWIPASPPVIFEPTFIDLLHSQKFSSTKLKRLTFNVTGPDQMVIIVLPKPNINLVGWSLTDSLPIPSHTWSDRPSYLMRYTRGLSAPIWQFWFDLEVPPDYGGPSLDIAVVGHYFHEERHRTTTFKDFLKKIPEWAHVTAWTATYKSYIF